MVHRDKPKKVLCIYVDRRGTFTRLHISPASA